jgi:integrase
MASIQRRPNGKWRARYRDGAGREHARHFERKADAQAWLDEETAKLVTGRWLDPTARKVTVDEWCERWLAGYSGRPSTIRQARTHLSKIRAEFGPVPLSAVRPSQIRSWLAQLAYEGHAPSYRHALHARLSQIMTDAVHDGVLAQSPCSRRTSPPIGDQRPYVATTEQVWGLYEAFPDRRRLAILLGAFAGLTTGEVCGLRLEDVAFLEREIRPALQWPAEPLKTPMRRTPIPVADRLLEAISVHLARWPGEWLLTLDDGGQMGPWHIQRQVDRARRQVKGLPEGFRFHDLRHYYASLLIASGADVKVVQHRVRHASAKTTLDTYGHLWPDSDESTRTAVERVLSGRLADSLRTERGVH